VPQLIKKLHHVLFLIDPSKFHWRSNRLRSRIDKDKFLLAGTCFWLQLLRSSEVLHRTTQGSSAPLATQHAGAREGTASMHAENPHHLAIPL
jgi:hypothetical protein